MENSLNAQQPAQDNSTRNQKIFDIQRVKNIIKHPIFLLIIVLMLAGGYFYYRQYPYVWPFMGNGCDKNIPGFIDIEFNKKISFAGQKIFIDQVIIGKYGFKLSDMADPNFGSSNFIDLTSNNTFDRQLKFKGSGTETSGEALRSQAIRMQSDPRVIKMYDSEINFMSHSNLIAIELKPDISPETFVYDYPGIIIFPSDFIIDSVNSLIPKQNSSVLILASEVVKKDIDNINLIKHEISLVDPDGIALIEYHDFYDYSFFDITVPDGYSRETMKQLYSKFSDLQFDPLYIDLPSSFTLRVGSGNEKKFTNELGKYTEVDNIMPVKHMCMEVF